MESNMRRKFYSEREALPILLGETGKDENRMEIDLIKECLYFLYPEDEEADRAYIERTLPVLHEKLGFNKPVVHVRYRKLRLAAVATLMVLLVMLLASAIAYAFGINIFNFFVYGTDEYWMIHVQTEKNAVVEPAESRAPVELYNAWGDAVTERLKEMDTIPPLPTSMLEGYAFVSHTYENFEGFYEIDTFRYTNSSQSSYLKLVIRRFGFDDAEHDEFLQKDKSVSLGEKIHGIEYYFSQNYDVTSVMWMMEEYEVTISGTCTIDELHSIIETVR